MALEGVTTWVYCPKCTSSHWESQFPSVQDGYHDPLQGIVVELVIKVKMFDMLLSPKLVPIYGRLSDFFFIRLLISIN